MILSKHQIRLLERMVEDIDKYKKGNMELASLASRLEGAFNASEIDDKCFYDIWFECWKVVEIQNALFLENLNINKKLLEKNVCDMDMFLKKHLEENKKHD